MQGSEYHETKEVKDIYPDFVMMAKSFGLPGKRVFTPEELRPAIRSAVGLPCWAVAAACALGCIRCGNCCQQLALGCAMARAAALQWETRMLPSGMQHCVAHRCDV